MISRTIHDNWFLSMLRNNTLHYDVGTVLYPNSLRTGSPTIDDGFAVMLCHNRNGLSLSAMNMRHNQALIGIKAITEYERLTS